MESCQVELVELVCPQCDYKADLLVGTQERSQTLSDMNEDFAFYKLFKCAADGTLQSIDVHNREFDGDCPEHKVKLKALTRVPENCPRCDAPVKVTEKDIGATPTSSTQDN